MKKNYTLIIIIFMQIILTACGKQQALTQQNNAPKPTVITSSTSKTNVIPNKSTPPNLNNFANNNHNPFQPGTNANNNSSTSPAQSINQYPISSLSMVGTMTSDSQVYALISSPDGNTSKATTGDKIGKEQGEIISITSEQVIIKITQDYNGSSYQQLVELTLNKQSAQSGPGLSV